MVGGLSSFINSNSCSSSTFGEPIFSTSTNSRISREVKLQCKSSVVKRSEGTNSVVNRKPDAVQREGSNITYPSIDYNFRCLFSVLRGERSLSGTENKTPMDSRGTEKPYNILEPKVAKLAILTFTCMHPKLRSIHLQMDNTAGLPYKVRMGGTRNKVVSDTSNDNTCYWKRLLWVVEIATVECFGYSGNLGFESRSRFSVAVYEGLKRMETKTTDFLKYSAV